ncbi:MAG: hypothetical protein MJ232_07935 [archaeon]|nr:hypothetical protein [archaeon]
MIDMNEYFNHLDELDNKDALKETTKDTLSNLKEYMSKVVGTKNEYNNVEIVGEVYIGSNVKIDSFTKIVGPVIINNDVEISTNVYIRPNTIIGSDVKIGHGSEIKESLIMNGAKIATNVFVGNSIIGNKARIGSGTILANRRFDQNNITIKNYNTNEKNETDLDFFGAVVGDNSRLGANTTTMPGCHIGHDTFVASGMQVGGVIESDVMVDNEAYKNLKTTKKEKIELK